MILIKRLILLFLLLVLAIPTVLIAFLEFVFLGDFATIDIIFGGLFNLFE